MNLAGLVALAALAIEWLALGWLSDVDWDRTEQGNGLWAMRWALRLLTGAVLVAASQLVLALLGLGLADVLAVLIGAAVLALGVRFATWQPRTARAVDERMTNRERIGWWLLAAILLAATVRSVVVPEAGWDAFSHWGLRAQAYAVAGAVVNAGSEHEYYPPLVPFLEMWLYLHRGAISIDLGKMVWALIGSAFGVCLAGHLRLLLRHAWLAPWLATGMVLVTPSLLEGFSTGQADLPLTTFLTLATLAILQWLRQPGRGWLVQAGIFATAAALTKLEGAPRIGIVLLALIIEGALVRRWMSVLATAGLALATAIMVVLWTMVAARAGISSNSEHLGRFQPFALGTVAVALVAVFGGLRSGGGLAVTALTWLLAARRLACPPVRFVTLVAAGQLAATLIAFLVTDVGPDVEVRTSATRLFGQWLPLALCAGVLALDAHSGDLSPAAEDTYNRRGR